VALRRGGAAEASTELERPLPPDAACAQSSSLRAMTAWYHNDHALLCGQLTPYHDERPESRNAGSVAEMSTLVTVKTM